MSLIKFVTTENNNIIIIYFEIKKLIISRDLSFLFYMLIQTFSIFKNKLRTSFEKDSHFILYFL